MRFMRTALFLGLALTAGVSPAWSAESYSIEFDPDQMTVEAREGFDVVRVDGCDFVLEPGQPMLPARTVHLSIPAGMRAVGVRIVARDQVDLGDGFRLYPSQPPVKLSQTELPPFVAPDDAVYGSSGPFPPQSVELTGTGDLGGYAVVGLRVFPLEYIPRSERLIFNHRIELVIELEEAPGGAELIRGRSERAERLVADRVRALVSNPDEVAAHIGPRADGARDTQVEYVIITGPSFVDEFQPLADWKHQKGVSAAIFDTDWIYANYSGYRDDQESIREFIRDYEANHGLVYVLLGGDVDVVPARTAWDDLGYDGIRADLYFSDTDGDWNADGDSYWGEHPADNVDMYGDVYVGRAPVDTPSEVTNFVQQVLTYEGAQGGDPLPTDFLLDMLFMAEDLWSDPYYDGGFAKNLIDDESVPSRFDPITKLYEDDGSLSYTAAMSAMNDGPAITNHIGHSNYYVMSINPDELVISDMDALVNGTRKGIFYTIGCWAAAFDYDNIAEHYVNNPDGGGVAFVGNSRYGWACPGYPGECVNDLYDRQFFQALFARDLYHLGITLADAKDYYVPDARDDDYMRYGLYELNILGDPEMPIWTRNPAVFTVTHPLSIPTGLSPFTVEVNVGPTPEADACVCLWKGSEVYEVGYTDVNGEAAFEVGPTTEGTMTVTVTKHDHLPYEGESVVYEGTPPARPTGLLAEAGDGEVKLTWNPNPEPDLDYYIIYRDTSPHPNDSLAAVSAPDTSFLDSAVMNDTTYYYRLQAVDSEGDHSVYSEEVSATPAQPPVIFITHTPLADTDDPFSPYSVDALITSTEAPLNPDSVLVMCRWQQGELFSPWEGTRMTETGEPDEYTADIACRPCGTLIQYYILAVDADGNRETHPDMAPAERHSFSVNHTLVLLDEFESDSGWTAGVPGDDATTGMWERCDPEGTEAQAEDDHTPDPGVEAYITGCAAGSGQGSYDIDGGRTTLLSPIFDLTNYSSATVSYYRWYSNDTGSNPGEDHWIVEVSDDAGASWATLENTNQSSRSWTLKQFDLGSYVTLTDQIRFRFVASDSGDGSLVEAGVDDFSLLGCPLAPTSVAEASEIGEVVLRQNRPNPFNPVTEIEFGLPVAQRVRLEIYDVRGRLVRKLAEGVYPRGYHRAVWQGRDDQGAGLATGVYFYRLATEEEVLTRKMLLIK